MKKAGQLSVSYVREVVSPFLEEPGSPRPRPWEKGQVSSTKQVSPIYFQPPAGSKKARDSQALMRVRACPHGV